MILLSQLRDIEILVQQQVEVLEGEGKDDHTLREIQKILYSTEVRNCDWSHSIIPLALITFSLIYRKDSRFPKPALPLTKRRRSKYYMTTSRLHLWTFSFFPRFRSVRITYHTR